METKEREITVHNKENKVAEDENKILERKAYLLDKVSNLNKRETILQNHNDFEDKDAKLKASEI